MNKEKIEKEILLLKIGKGFLLSIHGKIKIKKFKIKKMKPKIFLGK